MQAADRCGYCLAAQRYVYSKLQIEHILPRAAGGSDEEDNLWLACSYCNDFKNDQTKALDPATKEIVPLFNPRRQRWAEHFAWSAEGTQIVGITP
jgi:5-methylcytosine-specific restriction endonuclease McrA